MRPIRWTAHAATSLRERDIKRPEAERTIEAPDREVIGRGRRKVFIRRYEDAILAKPMAMCVVVEERPEE